MLCPHCGNETRDSSAFCTRCGRHIGNRPPGASSVPPAAPAEPQTRIRHEGEAETNVHPAQPGATQIRHGQPAAPAYGPPQPPAPYGQQQPWAPPPPSRGGNIGRVVPFILGGVVLVAAAAAVVQSQLKDSPTPGAGTAPPATGAVLQASPTPGAVTPTPVPPVDCREALHPEQGSQTRKVILDGMRRHYNYQGLYTVQFVTVFHGWAYLEAAPYDERTQKPATEFRGYLLRYDGTLWNWRWEGPTGAEADGPGNPPYPSDFDGQARGVLRC